MLNGFQSEFKVYPVQMVARASKTSRENSKRNQKQPSPEKNSLFDTCLRTAMENKAPADCYTVTYNANSQLQTYYYHQSMEYTF